MSELSVRLRHRFHRVTGGRLRGFRTLIVAFLRLDLIEEASYPLALVLQELAVLVPVLSYFFIGELVGGSEVVGGDYFTFAAIGISVSLMLDAVLSSFGKVLQRSQNRGQFEYLLSEPVPWLFLPFAMNLYRVVFGVFNGFLILGIAELLGADFLWGNFPEFLVLMILGFGASTAIGLLAASVMVVAKRSQPMLTLYSLAASLLGGALFSVDQLPLWLRTFSYLIPHTYVINAARTILMEDPGSFTMPLDTAGIVLGFFNVFVLSGGLWIFHRALQYARREGILGGY